MAPHAIRPRTLLLLAAAGLAACGDVPNPAALRIVGNIIPDDSCTVKTSGGAQQSFLARGILDVSIGTNYLAFLMVTNEFPEFEGVAQFQPEDARLDPSKITVDGLEIEIKLPSAIQEAYRDGKAEIADFNTALNKAKDNGFEDLGFLPGENDAAEYNSPTIKFFRPFAVSVEPNSSNAVITDIVPAPFGQAFRSLPGIEQNQMEIILSIRAVGRRQDGVKVISGTFDYPLIVCYRCLVVDAFDASSPIAQNPLNPSDGSDPLKFEDLICEGRPLCAAGNNTCVFNPYCGAVLPPSASCARARCFGTGTTLTCPEDPGFLTGD